MRSMTVRLLLGLAMLLAALLFTGVLAAVLEQRAAEFRPVDETYVPPKLSSY
ncbi:MAG: hypothetical protein KIS73_12940 [Enhydrobacter sp.]|nr:hypothetical protein [Enhydrobacter sp.]